jgi:hypothetical protein
MALRALLAAGALLLGVLAFVPAASATPPGCNPGPLPGTCCPPNADCACLLCNVHCAGLVPCEAAGTHAISLPVGGWCSGEGPRYACLYLVQSCDTVCGTSTELCVYWAQDRCQI